MLGSPVINVELTDDQLSDNINLALETFTQFVEGGVNIRMLTLTTETGQKEYSLPFTVASVLKLFDAGSLSTFEAVFPERAMADTFGGLYASGDLLTLELTRSYMSTLEFQSTVDVRFNYNSSTNEIYLIEDPGSQTLGLLCYEKTDYTETTKGGVYNHLWIKKYAVALCRKQWGMNLTKYSGSMLPQGLTMNGTEIYQQALTDLEKLETELEETWRMPLDFFVG